MLVAARMGAGTAVTDDPLLGIDPTRLGEIAALGAAVAVAASLLLRALPVLVARALRGGFWVGAAAMAIVQQGATFLLFRLFGAVPSQGFNMAPMPEWSGAPEFLLLVLAGGLAGMVLGLLLRFLPLPDLLTGLALGALGLSTLSGILPLPPLTLAAPGWWANLVINGGWGLATALLLRPLVLSGTD
ncbi:hypothetical protein MHZ93_24160 [Roseomonas sp. ACRSG]|nr:hypothetical protein [Roseomonas sp. ACRSG]